MSYDRRGSRLVSLAHSFAVFAALSFFAAPVAAQLDPAVDAVLSKQFRKASQAALKQVKQETKAALAQLRADFAEPFSKVFLFEFDNGNRVGQAVDAVARQRATLEQVAYASAEYLRDYGEALLAGAPLPELDLAPDDDSGDPVPEPEPPPAGATGGSEDVIGITPQNFRAGSGGLWDAHMQRLEALLSANDARVAKLFEKQRRRLEKLGDAQDTPVAIGIRLPPHGIAHTLVPSPNSGAASPGALPDRVFALARMVEPGGIDELHFGTAVFDGELDFTIQEVFGDSVTTNSATGEDPIVFTPLLRLHELFDAPSSVVLGTNLDGDDEAAEHFAMEPPVVDAPAQPQLVKAFNSFASAPFKQFKQGTKLAVADLKQELLALEAEHAALEQDAASALLAGFDELVTSRDIVSLVRDQLLGQLFSPFYFELVDLELVSHDDFPDALRLHAGGYYTKLAAKWQKLESKRQAQLSKLFASFQGRIEQRAAQNGELLAVSAAVGRVQSAAGTVIPVLGEPGLADHRMPVHLSDALMVASFVDDEFVTQGSVAGGGDTFQFTELSVVLLSDSESDPMLDPLVPQAAGFGSTLLPTANEVLAPSYYILAGRLETLRREQLFLTTPQFPGLD